MISYFLLGGDGRFFWPENLGNFAHIPYAWDNILNTGIGQLQTSPWITSYLNLTAFFNNFGLSWNAIEFIFWILPSIVISFLSSVFLFRYLFKKEIKYSFLAGIIYTFNTYFLMTLTGGQLGVALSYSFIPFVMLSFIKLIDKFNLKNSIQAGIFLGLETFFDPRIVYITLACIFIYYLFNASKFRNLKNLWFPGFSFLLALFLNSFWILPFIVTGFTVPAGFGSSQGFGFFSFADFSHAFSLLHPNWPENIFGKTYFLKPEFLVLPILAFSSLLFKKNKNILIFSIIAILGAFLSKGVNDPFGFINDFLFNHLPGMVLFRDPVKWYTLVALSYSILIPFSLSELSRHIKSKIKFSIFNLQFSKAATLAFILYFMFLISPIVKQIKIQQVPQDYAHLKNFLSNQKTFSRTLWIPAWQRFGYFSNNHPAIGRNEFLKGDYKKQINELIDDEKILQYYSVKYVIVPYDSQGEIFLKDRKYDEKQYNETISSIAKIPWLKHVGSFGKIAVFEAPSPKDHFWSPSSSLKINYSFVDATNYKVQVENAKKGDILVFSEAFDKNWEVEDDFRRIKSKPFDKIFNSFILTKNGSYKIKVYYNPQNWVKLGTIISGLTLIFILGLLRLTGSK